LADSGGYTVVPTEQTIVRAKVELLELAKQLGGAYTQKIAQVAAGAKAKRAKERVEMVGELLDVSISKRTFRMKADDKIIQGKFGDAISSERPVQLPKSYRATLKVLQKLVFDDGNEEIIYFLERLESPERAVDRKQP
jgi:hypothetical protein